MGARKRVEQDCFYSAYTACIVVLLYKVCAQLEGKVNVAALWKAT